MAIASPSDLNHKEILHYSSATWFIEIIGEVQGKDIDRVLLGGKQISYNKDTHIFSDKIELHYGNNQIDLLVLDKDGKWLSRSWKIIRETPNTPLILKRGDLRNSGVYKSREVSGKLKEQLWKNPKQITSLAINHNKLYCGSEDYHLYTWNTNTKKVDFKNKTNATVHCAPVIHNDVVYFGSDDGHLYAVDEQGKQLWKFETYGAIWSSPIIVENSIIFGSFDGYLYSVDIKTHSLQWKFLCGAKIVSSPAFHRGKLCFGSVNSHVYCVDQKLGIPFGNIKQMIVYCPPLLSPKQLFL